jgi:transcriptional repressor NrdR
MICPFCGYSNTKVIITREVLKFNEVKRRRECEDCKRRFTTYERVERMLPIIIKKDGSKESFSREKLIRAIQKAAGKHRIQNDNIQEICKTVELELENKDLAEVTSLEIGKITMSELKKYDKIAYIRFASEYRAFSELEEFVKEVNELLKNEENNEK